jgi:hypothetical protein
MSRTCTNLSELATGPSGGGELPCPQRATPVVVDVALLPPTRPPPLRRPARVARMLALAHHLQAAIDRGQLADRAHAARCLGLTRARVTQLLDLALLAPDLQEEVLFLEAVGGIEPLAERDLRAVVRHRRWSEQRRAFA